AQDAFQGRERLALLAARQDEPRRERGEARAVRAVHRRVDHRERAPSGSQAGEARGEVGAQVDADLDFGGAAAAERAAQRGHVGLGTGAPRRRRRRRTISCSYRSRSRRSRRDRTKNTTTSSAANAPIASPIFLLAASGLNSTRSRSAATNSGDRCGLPSPPSTT